MMTNKQWILALALFGLAACSDKPAPEDTAEAAAEPAQEQAAAPKSAPEPASVPVAAPPETRAPLQAADVEAYLRGMEKEVQLLRSQYARIEQARADGDSEAEVEALFAMTANGVDEAGASAAGMTKARYGFVKEQFDDIGSKLAMLAGLAAMEGDMSRLQAQVGDPYAGLEAPIVEVLKARQGDIDALRGEAIGLRLKAAGG